MNVLCCFGAQQPSIFQKTGQLTPVPATIRIMYGVFITFRRRFCKKDTFSLLKMANDPVVRSLEQLGESRDRFTCLLKEPKTSHDRFTRVLAKLPEPLGAFTLPWAELPKVDNRSDHLLGRASGATERLPAQFGGASGVIGRGKARLGGEPELRKSVHSSFDGAPKDTRPLPPTSSGAPGTVLSGDESDFRLATVPTDDPAHS